MTGWIHDQIEGGSRQDFGRATSGVPWNLTPRMHVLHTTEGSSWPGYVNGGNAPHFTINPAARETRQHFSLDGGSRALVPGPTSANQAGTVQYEIIGYAAQTQDMSDTDLAYIAHVLSVVAAHTGIKAQCSVEFKGSAGAYGVNSSTRMTPATFLSYEGIAGHQHVPGNSHWDPGMFPVARLLALMGGTVTPVDHVVTPPAPTSPSRILAADGIWGVLTTKALQRLLGVNADGIFGPITTKALQRLLGVKADGLFGPITKRALQRRLGVTADGIFGPISTRALQRALNAGRI